MKINESYAPPHEGSISSRQFTKWVMAGKVVDGRPGGLLFGRTFDEGGVRLISKVGSGYHLQGVAEGGSFIVNWAAAVENLARLKFMNSGMTMREIVKVDESNPPEISLLVEASARPHDKLVYLHWAQIVVGREATAKHLGELNEMNRAPNPYLQCDHYQLFNCEPGTEDGIV